MQFQVQFVNSNYQKNDSGIDLTARSGQVTDQVKEMLKGFKGEMSRGEILKRLRLKHNPTFRQNYLLPALEAGLIEMTQPSRPKSPTQKYRLTQKGLKLSKVQKTG